jgi:hypothetical protein
MSWRRNGNRHLLHLRANHIRVLGNYAKDASPVKHERNEMCTIFGSTVRHLATSLLTALIALAYYVATLLLATTHDFSNSCDATNAYLGLNQGQMIAMLSSRRLTISSLGAIFEYNTMSSLSGYAISIGSMVPGLRHNHDKIMTMRRCSV